MDNAPEQHRLFIAIEIPDEVKTALEQAQAELRRVLPETTVRWARRDQFHLTLRFLGDVTTQRAEALIAAVRHACQGLPPLQIQAARVGFFPDARFPRVVWAGVRDQEDQLPSLQQSIQAATETFTAEKPEAQFTGHVTLGRIKSLRRPQAEKLVKAAAALTDQAFGAWTAREIAIIRSELTPTGARHTTLVLVPLGKATADGD